MNDIQHYLRAGLLQLHSLPPLSLYIHLPWCIQKCPYCDFNSHAVQRMVGSVGHSQQGLQQSTQQRYIAALLADLDAALPLVWGRTVHSIFMGGGTPSLFAPEHIADLLSQIRARLRLSAEVEITLEANPGTFERDRFKAFREAGVNRLSVGVQSFNDKHLKALGRVHSSAQAKAALEEAAACFDTFNLDLMYALPNQTMEDLRLDVDTALSFRPPHLSIYHLTIEPNTYFAKYPPPTPDEDTAYAMLDVLTERTTDVGLQRYEVSAFAQEGHRCWHNLNYWQFGDYLGIGAGAHSKLSFAHRIIRQVRTREPLAYMDAALRGDAVTVDEDIKHKELPFEFMLNALRLKDGVPLSYLTGRTGLGVNAIQNALQTAQNKGLMQTLDAQKLQATERGFDLLSDLQELFLPAT
ncbi:MAG: radical SAM family heme chaperone HemW [Cytophagales bacterium]|nr:radical SAM family heme chaperone HemW [Cytophagales bacterium]